MTAATPESLIRVTEREEEPEADDRVEAEWVPVASWPPRAAELHWELAQIREVRELLRTSPGPDHAAALEILRAGEIGCQAELEAILLALHAPQEDLPSSSASSK